MMFKMSKLYKIRALIVVVFLAMSNLLSQNLYSQQWRPMNPCYCSNGYHYGANCDYNNFSPESVTMDYMGCTVLITLAVVYCENSSGDPYIYVEIQSVNYSAGGNCATLHLYLHPQGGNQPDAARVKQMYEDLYGMIFDDRFDAMKSQYYCPNTVNFEYFWPGSCSMACELILGDQAETHVFQLKSCQDFSCCSRSYSYCLNQNGTIWKQIINNNFPSACPVQTDPDFSKCPAVGTYFNGIIISGVNASYCQPYCE